jgi:tight adherence protein C
MIAIAAAFAAVAVLVGSWRWRPPPARVSRLVATRRHRPDRRHVRRVVTLVALGGLTALFPPCGIAAAVATVGLPRWRRARAAARARAAMRSALPDVIDLVVVAIGAGLTPSLAMARLATIAPAPFADAFARVAARQQRGVRLADALESLEGDLGADVHPLVAALTASERYGTPLGPALEVLAQDARAARRRWAEERARTVPVKLCFPLVCCTLPAFVLLTIAPLVAGAVRSLRL